MESNNSNDNSLKKYSVFSTDELGSTNSSNAVQNNPQSNLSQQQVFTINDLTQQVMKNVEAQLFEKIGDKGINVIEQRKVIESQSQEKKVLEEQLKQSLVAQEELKKQLNELHEKVSNINGFGDLSGIENKLKDIEKFQIQQKLKPIIEFMENQGINKQDIPGKLDYIQKNFKSDFYINPDQKLVEFVLWKEQQATINQPNYTLPKGSYNINYAQQSTQVQQQILQQKLAAKDEEIRQRVEARKRKAQIL